LPDLWLSLEQFNVLVGPNNSGKSSAISAFRLLSVALSHARARRPVDIPIDGRIKTGYWLSPETIPVSLDNVHTENDATDTYVRFQVDSGRALTLYFPSDGGCALLLDPEGPVVVDPTTFRRVYPVSVGVVPVLAAVEPEEGVRDRAYVRRSVATSRAPRHFRSYWYYFPEGFDAFSEQVAATWPGVTGIARPRLHEEGHLIMSIVEGGRPRELAWAGFGFQVWCQLITHISRMSDNDLVVIDEPEVYLHPDLQRRLVGLLQDLGPDILIATHSSEIVTEVDPRDLLVIDKGMSSAKRSSGPRGVRNALAALGSNQNLVLSNLARTRRVIFVEGEDFKTLRRFARTLGFTHLAASAGLVPYPLGGFPSIDALPEICRGIEAAIGSPVLFAGVFDRDFRSDIEVDGVEDALGLKLTLVHIWYRKELENYLLEPALLDRALRIELSRRAGRSLGGGDLPDIRALLDQITQPFRDEVESKYVAARLTVREIPALDISTAHRQLMDEFKRRWAKLDIRLGLVPGKRTLSRLNETLHTSIGISLSNAAVIAAMRVGDVNFEVATFLRQLEAFRQLNPDDKSAWRI
jgi:energy-coupling factor transporter ATP-binding protein EcfA2